MRYDRRRHKVKLKWTRACCLWKAQIRSSRGQSCACSYVMQLYILLQLLNKNNDHDARFARRHALRKKKK